MTLNRKPHSAASEASLPSTAPAVIVHGPMAIGKTTHAAALAAHFGVTIVVDDWDPRHHELVRGALHLTHSAVILRGAVIHAFQDIPFDPAVRAAVRFERARGKRRYAAEPRTHPVAQPNWAALGLGSAEEAAGRN